MLDSIYVGMTGLQGYSQGLRVIANNTANINTPGFKASTLQFADMFYSTTTPGTGSGLMQVGYGLGTAGTTLDFKQGELRQTGNTLDLAVDGQGLFTVKDSEGNLHYTRAGQFMFDSSGVLVNRVDGSKVMGMDANGVMGEISIKGKSTLEGKATTTVTFAGNLSSTSSDHSIGQVMVIDGVGGTHELTVNFTASTTDPGRWSVELMDGSTSVGTGEIVFTNGEPDPSKSKVSLTYKPPAGLPNMPLVLDFGTDVTSFAAGNLSTLAFQTQDGYAPGGLTGASFDDSGTLVLAYSNGQTVKDARLALGRFDSLDAIRSIGENAFDATNSLAWHIGTAGTGSFGRIRSGMVELSNVDLSREFSDLVIMQRGYQASSQVISTANEMLQELFTMKNK